MDREHDERTSIRSYIRHLVDTHPALYAPDVDPDPTSCIAEACADIWNRLSPAGQRYVSHISAEMYYGTSGYIARDPLTPRPS